MKIVRPDIFSRFIYQIYLISYLLLSLFDQNIHEIYGTFNQKSPTEEDEYKKTKTNDFIIFFSRSKQYNLKFIR